MIKVDVMKKLNSKTLKKIITVSAAGVMSCALVLTQVLPICQGVKGVSADGGKTSLISRVDGNIKSDLSQFYSADVVQKLPDSVSSNDEISVIVEMNTRTLMDAYEAGAKTASASSVGEFALTSAGKAVSAKIAGESRTLLSKLTKAGVKYTLGNEYDVLFGGFEVTIRAKDFDKLNKAVGNDATVIVGEVYEECKTEVVTNDVNVHEETGIFDSSDSKYDGSGVVVAVLDTGLDYTHSAFDVSRFTSKDPRMSRETIGAVIGETVAAQKTPGLTASDVYLNAKIPFAYDYADNDADVYPIASEHGTHVSGVIVGNDDVIKGVAPNAQLVSCKVFSDRDSGARSSWILAALEDCVKLGVDVINMSLGTAAGFSREADKENTDKIYDAVREAGISLVCAASNDYNSTYGSEKNGNLGLTSNPDSATVGSPSTYDAALSVASISGVKTPYLLYGDSIMYFTEASNQAGKPKNFVDELLPDGLKEKDYEYVRVPGVGRSTDYNGVDVTGKIALVKRGSTSFEEKARVAMDKGAAGIIIYNNVSGDIAMSVGNVSIAVCSISRDNGELLAAKPSGTIKISREQTAGPFMSDFSSWGPTEDLGIKPEITAHGGEILSSVPGQDYERMSGTSMASPNQAGVTALVRQYVEETFPALSRTELAARVNQVMMSTTDIAKNTNGLAYSVRKQGAGLANLAKATSSPAYITTYGRTDGEVMDKTKIELGDDPHKDGVYTLKFTVNNFKTSSLTYDVNAIVMTEGVSEMPTEQGDTTVSQLGYLLDAASVVVTKVEGGTNSGNSVTVAGGKSATVTLTITLGDKDKEYLNKSFANGMYVEGFVTLTATSGTDVDLSVPYLAFYGDWTRAPLFDKDYYETNKDEIDDSLDFFDKTLPDAFSTVAVGGIYSDYITYLGAYPFTMSPSDTKIAADRKYISLSNQATGDSSSTVNNVYAVWAGGLRGAKKAVITVTESSTGKVIYEKTVDNVRKSFNYGGGIIYSNIEVGFNVADYDLKNNTQYDVKVVGYLDYGDGGIDTNLNNTFEFPFVTDFEAPAITGCEFYTEYDKDAKKNKLYARVSVYDNHYSLGAVVGYVSEVVDEETNDSSYALESFGRYITPIYSDFNSTSVFTYELTDYLDAIQEKSHDGRSFIVEVLDYAENSAIYEITIPDDVATVYFSESKDNTTRIDSLTISPYETKILNTVVTPSESWAETLEFATSDASVARVVNGKLLGVAPGTATITATSRKNPAVKATLEVTVLAEGEPGYRKFSKPYIDTFEILSYTVNEVFYASSSANRDLGTDTAGTVVNVTSSSFALKMYPSEAVTIDEQDNMNIVSYFPGEYKLQYQSNNSAIVAVDENGKITAQSEGITSVVIRVMMDGKNVASKTIPVSVKDPYTSSGGTLSSYKGLGGEVVIPDDLMLTTIGQYAFSQYQSVPKDDSDEISDEDPYLTKIAPIGDTREEKISKVVIPEGVEVIDSYAFAYLTGLKEVVLPSTLKKISQGAFMGCTALETVTGLENVKFINDYAFYGCNSLKEVNFGKLIAIGNSAFELVQTRENEVISAFESLILPESAQSVGARAFYGNTSLRDLDIQADKVKLGSYAFGGCTALMNVEVNASVVPTGVFSGCTSLRSVTLGEDVSEIGMYAFKGTKVAKFTVASENAFFKANAQGSALLSKDGKTLRSVAPTVSTFTENNVTAVDNAAFSGNEAITSVSLPKVTEVGSYAFADCVKLSSVTVGKLKSVGDYAFYQTKIKELPAFEASLNAIGNYAFFGTDLISVTIPNGMKIGAYAFGECTSLKTVNIGDDVTIGEGAFIGAVSRDFLPYDGNYQYWVAAYVFDTNLTNLTIGKNAAIGAGAFAYLNKLTAVTLGENAKIGAEAFFADASLQNIDLSKVTEIGGSAFSGMLTPVYTLSSSYTPTFAGYLGYPDENDPTWYEYLIVPKLTEIDLSSCKVIGAGAFSECMFLNKVTFGEGIKEIGDMAFYECASLTDVTGLENAQTIGDGAFYFAALKTADLSGATEIGDGAFAGCGNLKSVTLNEEGVTLGVGAFIAASSLAEVNGLEYATVIGAEAFRMTALESANLSGAAEIGGFAFADTKVTEVTLGEHLNTLGENPFTGCEIPAFTQSSTGAETFDVSENVSVIDGALYQKVPNGLELITYPLAKTDEVFKVAEGTVRISAQAFMNSAVKSVELPLELKAIGDKAFYQCENLVLVVFRSVSAPVLEEQYNYDLMSEQDENKDYYMQHFMPYTGTELMADGKTVVEGLGIVPFFMWNVMASPTNIYYGANFINYVGHEKHTLLMVRPSNGEYYESFVYGKYFDSVVDGAVSPLQSTLDAINAIDKIPSKITLGDKDTIEAARAAYDKVIAPEQQILVTNYEKLTVAERVLAALSAEPEKPEPVEEEGSSAVVITLAVLTGVFGLIAVAASVMLCVVLVSNKKKQQNVVDVQSFASDEEKGQGGSSSDEE